MVEFTKVTGNRMRQGPSALRQLSGTPTAAGRQRLQSGSSAAPLLRGSEHSSQQSARRPPTEAVQLCPPHPPLFGPRRLAPLQVIPASCLRGSGLLLTPEFRDAVVPETGTYTLQVGCCGATAGGVGRRQLPAHERLQARPSARPDCCICSTPCVASSTPKLLDVLQNAEGKQTTCTITRKAQVRLRLQLLLGKLVNVTCQQAAHGTACNERTPCSIRQNISL